MGIAIHQDVALLSQKTVEGMGEVPGDLHHQVITKSRRASNAVNAASGDFQNKWQIVGHQAAFGPDLDRREANRSQDVPMGFNELPLFYLSFPIRSRPDPMLLENVTVALVGHFVVKIRQRALNPIVSPRGIITDEPQNKIDDLLFHTWPVNGFATLTVIPFLSRQLAENRVGCNDGSHLAGCLAPKSFLSLPVVVR